ncbi:cardiolipin synthase [Paenibacillus sp. y28]|uniref:cardiolipin synthase n=1 Tax=Paenibacillus sp. y28 TaxID=3129110 RepID=UPI00301963EA
MSWLVILLLFFFLQMGIVLVSEHRHPAKAVAWLVILYLFPLFGFALYYFIAKRYTQRRKLRRQGIRMLVEIRRVMARHVNPVKDPEQMGGSGLASVPRLFNLLNRIPASQITSCNEVKVLKDGEETFAAILAAMEGARRHIHLAYYTIREDGIGRRFLDLMMKKARSGVEVRLIFDGVGSYQFSSKAIQSLRQAGVEVNCFLPPHIALFDKRINYRNHRKIVVVDGVTGYLGGINIGDEYLGLNPKLGHWRDTHLELRGDGVYYLQQTFLTDWFFVCGQRVTDARYFPEHSCKRKGHVQIIASGPDLQTDPILEMVFAAVAAANRRVWITTPYFIPDPAVMTALKTAALSGVDVRIIIPGVADSRLVLWASMSYVEELLLAGVRFFQYQQGFVHAKVLLVDDVLASVGTANMDMRSFFSNFELNAVLFDHREIARLESDYNMDEANCKELRTNEFVNRGRVQRTKEMVARLLSPLL